MLCTATLDISSSSKNINSTIFPFLDYAYVDRVSTAMKISVSYIDLESLSDDKKHALMYDQAWFQKALV